MNEQTEGEMSAGETSAPVISGTQAAWSARRRLVRHDPETNKIMVSGDQPPDLMRLRLECDAGLQFAHLWAEKHGLVLSAFRREPSTILMTFGPTAGRRLGHPYAYEHIGNQILATVYVLDMRRYLSNLTSLALIRGIEGFVPDEVPEKDWDAHWRKARERNELR